MFEIRNFLFANIYPKSGTDTPSRQNRENMFATTVPNMIRYNNDHIILAGDWNCITEVKDATHLPETKNSTSLKKLLQTFDVKDDFRKIHKNARVYSRHYTKQATIEGATRLDRIYSSRNVTTLSAHYTPATISDHSMLEVTYDMLEPFQIYKIPKPRLPFKIKPEIIQDEDFQSTIRNKVKIW